MENPLNRTALWLLISALLALLLSEVAFHNRKIRIDSEKVALGFQEAFLKKEAEMLTSLDLLAYRVNEKEWDEFSEYALVSILEPRYEREGLAFFIYTPDSLLFWSNNAVPIADAWQSLGTDGLLQLQNGWYFYHTISQNDNKLAVVTKIKSNYKYQNRFLVNNFPPDLPVTENIFFVSDKAEEGYPVVDQSGDFVLSLVLRRESGLYQTRLGIWLAAIFLSIAALLAVIYVLYHHYSRIFKRGQGGRAILAFPALMILFRLLLFITHLPTAFNRGELFSPTLYATSGLIPSLGDLLLHVLFFNIISYFLFSHLRDFKKIKFTGNKANAAGFLTLAGIMALCFLAIHLIRGLVIDSRLNLDVNFMFSLDMFSLIGFLIICLIFFSFFFLGMVLYRLYAHLLNDKKDFRRVLAVSLVVFLAADLLLGGFTLLVWLLFGAGILVFELDRSQPLSRLGLTPLVIALFLFSIISTFALYRFNTIKDQEKRKTFALKLASEQDPVAEYLFLEIEQTLYNDNQLKNLVLKDPYNIPVIYQYLQHHYFYDFWGKYNLQVTVCEPEEVIHIMPGNFDMACSWYFEDYIRTFGKPTISGNFYYLDNNTGRNSYIAMIPVRGPETEGVESLFHIYLEFDVKFVARDMGFPELLIDDKVDINRELANYSYANYKDGRFINKFGPYIYSSDLSVYGTFNQQFSFFNFDDYQHLVYNKDDDTQVIISRPRQSFLEGIAPFSYLFLVFFMLILVFSLLASRRELTEWFQLNFRRRVQVFMIGLVILSVITIGGASTWFMVNIYQDKNLSILNEKSHSVLVEMEHDLSGVEELSDLYEYYLSDMLLRLYNVFFTDINLYSPQGALLASSRPRVFDEGLVGSQMNPIAFAYLQNQQKSQFVQTEKIGKLEYLSAYVPLRNNQHQLLAYINLPYFAKQNELRNEISYFMLAFVNINLLLLVFAVIMALFISNHVTQPLQLIRDSISKLQLGKTDHKIHWTRNDEIGQMVKEYNRMIDELAVSAELLARSERESAWREMAKQVAHEIKNPLTPMRLSVQHLEKAWREKVPDWDQRLQRFSKTMVEQIDTLSIIAGEFSDFAKLPSGKNVAINLRDFAPEVLDLYNDLDKVEIDLQLPPGEEPLLVFSDRNQLLRVFNNLVRNAIQAYPRDEIARIQIICSAQKDFVKCEVRDFGNGIPDELKPSIFSPYFTTKTGGMGLGLSMVKNIIESNQGEVSFYSEEGSGTTFFFTLPVYKPEP